MIRLTTRNSAVHRKSIKRMQLLYTEVHYRSVCGIDGIPDGGIWIQVDVDQRRPPADIGPLPIWVYIPLDRPQELMATVERNVNWIHAGSSAGSIRTAHSITHHPWPEWNNSSFTSIYCWSYKQSSDENSQRSLLTWTLRHVDELL